MSIFDKVLAAWRPALLELDSNIWFERLKSGHLGVQHYKMFLRETYFQAGMNPQIQAAATIYMKGRPRKIFQKFYQHAISEIGHDILALNDLSALGEDVEDIPNQRPLPETVALTAFPLYEMQYNSNPLIYLGYLFHLEVMPTQNGNKYMEQLISIGVPKDALSFLEEHATVDISHNKLMQIYLESLILTKEDLDSVIYGARATCKLHGNMIIGAFEAADKSAKY